MRVIHDGSPLNLVFTLKIHTKGIRQKAYPAMFGEGKFQIALINFDAKAGDMQVVARIMTTTGSG